MTRKLCILCCIIVICFLVCFAVNADMAMPGVPTAPSLPGVRTAIFSDLRTLWGVITASVLAVAAFFAQLFHKK